MRHHSRHGHWGHRRGDDRSEMFAAFAEKLAMGRGHRGGGWGRRGGRDDDDGSEGFGRGFGGRGGGGRLLGHGDLRLLLLALIGEMPSHGYDLIRAVEERFAGAYAPSPGAVYPTLTMLEEQDLVKAEAAEGSKRLYTITDAGKAFLEENAAMVEGILARINLAAAAFARHMAPDEVHEAWKTLRQAMNMKRTAWTKEETDRVVAILGKAARDIFGKD
ncbi:MAG TPA: PadR family transcriptional regulator [Hyphomonadaceae bacterium]|nr:PadR family transcriptional regulator [Hyphomonadaceae bacterium]